MFKKIFSYRKLVLIISLMLIAIVIGGAVAVYADNSSETITAYFNNISLVVNGSKVNMPDAQPFIYNGHVYLPIKYVAEALGQSVNWDGNTQTVYVGSQPSGTLTDMDKLTPYYNSVRPPVTVENGAQLIMAGHTYLSGFQFNNVYTASDTIWNLNDQYTNFSALVGLDDSNNNSQAVVSFLGDGNVIKTIQLNHGDLPIQVSMSVTGVNTFEIKIKNTGSYLLAQIAAVDFANPILTKQ
jgi:hypothetical protein